MYTLRHVLLLFILAQISESRQITFSIPPGKTECFYEDYNKGEKVKVEIMVSAGGDKAISFSIRLSERKLLEKYIRFTDPNPNGSVEYKVALAGTLGLCFDNTMTSYQEKVISFTSEKWKNQQTADVKDGLASNKHMDGLMNILLGIHNKLDSMEEEQMFLAQYAKLYGENLVSLYSRVLRWSVIELVIIFGLAGYMNFVVRSWFKSSGTQIRV